MTPSPSEHLHIFISYSHKDTEHLDRLKVHLAPYLNSENAELLLWDDTRIQAGSKWQDDIKQALQHANAAILLISADFLASRFIRENELPPLLEAAAKKGIKVMPVILSPCGFESHKALSLFQVAHKPSQPLSSLHSRHKREEWWAQVAKNINDAIVAQKSYDTTTVYNETDRNRYVQEQQQSTPDVARPSSYTENDNSQGIVVGDHNTVNMYWHSPLPTSPADKPLSLQEFLTVYQERLHGDDDIAKLQVLGSDPLSVSDIYVRVRLHKDPRSRVEVEKQKIRDPLALIQQRQNLLEQRASTSMDPAKAIKQYKRCVILGDPGAGKTTLLKRLTIQSIDKELTGLPILPIYIKLHEAAKIENVNLFDFAVQAVGGYGFPTQQVAQLLEERMEAGEVLFLLDALDETVIGDSLEAAEASYKHIAEAIMRLTKRYSKVPIVITARKAGYFQRGQLVGFTELEVLDFLPQEIEQFIKKWFHNNNDARRHALAPKLINEIKRKPRVAMLAANPLLLSLIAISYENDDPQLPESRAQLYQRCIDTLLSRWDTSRFIERMHLIDSADQKQLLQQIAWHFHPKGLRYFSKSDLFPLMMDFLESLGIPIKEAPSILNEITSENGLLREQAHEIYGFLHLTIQEYFAADYVGNEVNLLLDHLGDPWWEEVILLFAGQSRDASPLLVHLLTYRGENEVPEDIFSSKLILAGRCLAARPRLMTNRQLREDIPSRLFNLLQETEYSLVQQHAAETLAEIGRSSSNDEITERLICYLTDDQYGEDIKEPIIHALSNFGSEQLATQLLTISIDQHVHMKPWFRDGVADILSKFGNHSMALMLLTRLEDKNAEDWFRATMAYLIGKINTRLVTSSLTSLITDAQTPPLVRASTATAIGNLDGTDALPTLLALISDPQTDPLTAENCLFALMHIGDSSAAKHLVSLLYNAEIKDTIRCRITDVLDKLGDETIVSQLSKVFFDDQVEADVRAEIAATLILYSNHMIDDKLLQILADEKAPTQIRRTIAWAFGTRSDQSVLPKLKMLSTDMQINPGVHRTIIFALGMQGDYSVVDELIQLLIREQFPDGMIEQVIKCIIKLADTSRIMAMLTNINIDKDWRIQIATALGETGKQSIVPALLQILTNRIVLLEVRSAVVSAIGQLAYDEDTVQKLADLLPLADIADEIHQALWLVSRKAGVTIIRDGPGGTMLCIVKR